MNLILKNIVWAAQYLSVIRVIPLVIIRVTLFDVLNPLFCNHDLIRGNILGNARIYAPVDFADEIHAVLARFRGCIWHIALRRY